jgi:hypothetical protein
MPEMLAVGIDGLLTGLDPVASDRLRLVRKGISPTGRAPDIDVELFALAVNNWHKAKIEGAQQRAGHNFVLMNQELIDAVSTELGGAPRTCSFWRIWASSQDESLTVDEQMFEAFEEYLAEEWPVSVVELTVTNLRRACQDLGLLGVHFPGRQDQLLLDCYRSAFSISRCIRRTESCVFSSPRLLNNLAIVR